MGSASPLVRSVVFLGVPLLLVVLAVVLLTAAAVASAIDVMPTERRALLFGAGALSWLAGVGWAMLANDAPRRARAS